MAPGDISSPPKLKAAVNEAEIVSRPGVGGGRDDGEAPSFARALNFRLDADQAGDLNEKARRREPFGRDERRSFATETLRPQPAAPPRQRRRAGWGLPVLLAAVLAATAGTVYYGFVATPGYVAEARFTVRSSDAASSDTGASGSSSLGIGSSAAQALSDSFMVSEYLRSPAAVQDIGRTLDLRRMFDAQTIDPISRLPAGSTPEQLASYWHRRVTVDYDPMTATVVLRAEAFTAADALALSQAALLSSDQLLNRLSEKQRADALQFSDGEMKKAEARLSQATAQFAAFQNAKGTLDPSHGATNQQDMLAKMEADLSTSRAQLRTMTSLGTAGPMRAALQARINAQEEEIRAEEGRLTKAKPDGKASASELISGIQQLQLERDFAEKDYQSALDFRQAARRNAERTQRYIVAYVSPVLPTQPVEPERLRMIGVVWFVVLVGTGILTLLTATIREHFL